MNRETILSLINALRTLNEITSQKDEMMRNHLFLLSNLIEEWILSHHRILTKIVSEISLKDTSEVIKKLAQDGLEIEKKVHNNIEEFQLSQKDLREREIEFDYILKEIENELK